MKALPLCDGAAFLAKFKRLFAKADGVVRFERLGKDRKQVSVYPAE